MKTIAIFILLLACVTTAFAQEPSRVVPFKIASQDTLQLHVFEPPADAPSPRPAIVFFFGGGWVSGSPEQFYKQAAYFASRGMVAISAEYRVKNRHQTTPFESVADAKSAIRWVRMHADELGIDPDRIVAAGGSAGGHVAAATALFDRHDDVADSLTISSKPVALVLFNPVLDTSENGFGKDRIGERALELSPVHQVKPDRPPTLIFHGTADTTVPFENAQRFCMAMTNAGNTCRLLSFEGMEHGFFNAGRHGNKPYSATVRAADEFLIGLGILSGSPTID